MLTALKVQSIVKNPVSKITKFYDEKGLFLKVKPTGNPSWHLKYRFSGHEQTASFGTYPKVSLAEARKKRDKFRAELADGKNPNEEKKKAKLDKQSNQEKLLKIIAEDWFYFWKTGHKEKTIYNKRMRLRYLPPKLLNQPIDKITTRDIADVIVQIQKDRSPTVAKFVLEIVKQIFSYAKSRGLLDNNPALGLSHLITKRQTKHRPAQVEPDAFADVLRTIEYCTSGPVTHSVLQILPYIFCRTGELRSMRWRDLHDLDGDKPLWSFLASKSNQEQNVPLAIQVAKKISDLKPLTGHSEFVFMGSKINKPISQSSIDTSMRKLGLKDIQTAHGFRASARTILDEVKGMRIDLIEQQLGHKVFGPLGRAYNRTTFIDERRIMMQHWADYLDELKKVTDNTN